MELQKHHGVSGEFAHSRALDGEHYASTDGGTNFHGLGESWIIPRSKLEECYPSPESPRVGIAWRLEATAKSAIRWVRRTKMHCNSTRMLASRPPVTTVGGHPSIKDKPGGV